MSYFFLIFRHQNILRFSLQARIHPTIEENPSPRGKKVLIDANYSEKYFFVTYHKICNHTGNISKYECSAPSSSFRRSFWSWESEYVFSPFGGASKDLLVGYRPKVGQNWSKDSSSEADCGKTKQKNGKPCGKCLRLLTSYMFLQKFWNRKSIFEFSQKK